WEKVQDQIAYDFVGVPAVYATTWMELLRPVSGKLLDALGKIFRDGQRRETERSLATDILAEYAVDEPKGLADLLMDAEKEQFAVLYPKLQAHGERGLAVLQSEVDKQLPSDAKNDARERLAKRKANAAVALLLMNQPAKVWPLLKHSPDARV